MKAIILTAGVGHRMISLTKQNNKALLPIGGVPIIERTITYLQEAGVNQIYIVTGHKHELFLPLQAKYDVTLIRNRHYATRNNLYSLYLALEHLDDAYLMYGDVLLLKNIFLKVPKATTIYTTYKHTRGVPMLEIKADKHYMLKSFAMCSEDKKLVTSLGVSYIAKSEAQLIRNYYQNEINLKALRDFKGEIDTALLPLTRNHTICVYPVDARYSSDINLITEYYDACLKYEELQKNKSVGAN